MDTKYTENPGFNMLNMKNHLRFYYEPFYYFSRQHTDNLETPSNLKKEEFER